MGAVMGGILGVVLRTALGVGGAVGAAAGVAAGGVVGDPMEGARFVEVGQARLYVQRAGAGEAVVFLHAGIADTRMWEPQWMPLRAGYEVIRFDRRGFGRTTSAPVPHAPEDDLRALLDALGVEAAHLVGCSMGSRTALDFTLAHPERVLSLTMVAPGIQGFDPGLSPTPAEVALVADLDAAVAAGDTEAINRLEIRYWVDGLDRPEGAAGAEVIALALDMNRRALALEASKGEGLPPARPAAGRLAEVRAPTLVVVGDADSPDTRAAAEALLAGINGARLLPIPNAGHLPNLERPEVFNPGLLAFLASISPRSR